MLQEIKPGQPAPEQFVAEYAVVQRNFGRGFHAVMTEVELFPGHGVIFSNDGVGTTLTELGLAIVIGDLREGRLSPQGFELFACITPTTKEFLTIQFNMPGGITYSRQFATSIQRASSFELPTSSYDCFWGVNQVAVSEVKSLFNSLTGHEDKVVNPRGTVFGMWCV